MYCIIHWIEIYLVNRHLSTFWATGARWKIGCKVLRLIEQTWKCLSACTGCANWNMPQEQNPLSIMMVTTLCINKCHHAFTHSQSSSSRFTHTTFATHGATHNWNNLNAESKTRRNNFLPLLLHIIYVLYLKNKLG